MLLSIADMEFCRLARLALWFLKGVDLMAFDTWKLFSEASSSKIVSFTVPSSSSSNS
jgi:hypothetical protein